MTTTTVVVLIILSLCVVLAALIVRESVRAEVRRLRPVLGSVSLPLQVPPAPPPSPPVVEPVRRPSTDWITLTFVNERGKAIGETKMRRQDRRPTITHTVKDGSRCTFVAASGDGRSFTYRKVGRERTH